MRKPLDVKSHNWYTNAHHGLDGRYINPWPLLPSKDDAEERSGWSFLISQLFGKKEYDPTPTEALKPADLAAPVDEGTARITWFGHSTALIQFPKLTILTDPVWANRVGPFGLAGPSRHVPPAISLAGLPRIDLVLISHNHYDHFDPKVLRFLQKRDNPQFFIPLDVGSYLPRDYSFTEFDWRQHVELDDFRIHCLPARHFSGRTLRDRSRSLWASWYIEPLNSAAPTIYFAGDTGYAPHFAEIHERIGAPDIVLMPIGAYRPRWMMRSVHVDPPEALRAFTDLGAKTLIPIHWGTYDLAEEPLHEPPEALQQEAQKAGLREAMNVLAVGKWVVVSNN